MRLGTGKPFERVARRDGSEEIKEERLPVPACFYCRAEHLELLFERIHEQIGWGGTGAPATLRQNRRHLPITSPRCGVLLG